MSDQNPYKAPASTDEASTSSGPVSAKTRELLGQASPWLRFLVILGYIFLIVGALSVIALGITAFLVGGSNSLQLISVSVVVLLFVVLYYFPLRILSRLAKGSKRYKADGEAAGLEQVASGVRGLAKFYGVLTIVIMSVYAGGGLIFGIAFLALGAIAH